MLVLWFALQLALVLGAVQLMGPGTWRHAGSFSLLVAALLLPWFVPAWPLPRALLCWLSLLAIVKVLQLDREPSRWSPRMRIWHALAPFDIAATQRLPRALDRALLGWTILYAALALGALTGLILLPRVLPFSLEFLRLVLGAILVYAGMDAVTGALRIGHRLAGIAVQPLQDQPILSRSIREFWSKRWNRPVSSWLESLVYNPVRRLHRPEIGFVVAFATSAALHGWLFLVSVGWFAAFSAAIFFLLQGFFVLVESVIEVRKASLGLRRLWTIGLLAVTSPLFVEPTLQVLGI